MPEKPATPLDIAIRNLLDLTGIEFHLSDDKSRLEFHGQLQISFYDRLYNLCSQGIVTGSIAQAIGGRSRFEQQVEITSIDIQKLQAAHDAEPLRLEQGEKAAQALTRLTKHVWAFNDRCLFTQSPGEGDPLFSQLASLHEAGALQGSPPYNKLQYETNDGSRREFISINDIDLARLRVVNLPQSQTGINF